jgi:hypothetical protein
MADLQDIATRYIATFNETDAERRRAHLSTHIIGRLVFSGGPPPPASPIPPMSGSTCSWPRIVESGGCMASWMPRLRPEARRPDLRTCLLIRRPT